MPEKLKWKAASLWHLIQQQSYSKEVTMTLVNDERHDSQWTMQKHEIFPLLLSPCLVSLNPFSSESTIIHEHPTWAPLSHCSHSQWHMKKMQGGHLYFEELITENWGFHSFLPFHQWTIVNSRPVSLGEFCAVIIETYKRLDTPHIIYFKQFIVIFVLTDREEHIKNDE